MKFKKIATIAAVSVLSCLAFTGCGSKTVDLNKYTTIEIDGYEGYGTATVSIDWDKIEKDNKNLKFSNGNEISSLYGSPVDYIADFAVGYRLSERTGLSNGDEVTLEWNCEDGLVENATNGDLKYKSMTVKVKGLTEVPKVDVFADVVVTFEGTAPEGTAKISGGKEGISYVLDKQSRLSNGDVVTVSVRDTENVDYLLKNCGGLPEASSKEYVVSGLVSYVKDWTEIDEKTRNQMEEKALTAVQKYFKDFYEDQNSVIWDGVKVVGEYVQIKKPGVYTWGNTQNCLGLILSIASPDAETGEMFDYYWFAEFDNVSILTDGSISWNPAEMHVPEANLGWFSSGTYFERNGLSYVGYENIESLTYDRVTNADSLSSFDYVINMIE